MWQPAPAPPALVRLNQKQAQDLAGGFEKKMETHNIAPKKVFDQTKIITNSTFLLSESRIPPGLTLTRPNQTPPDPTRPYQTPPDPSRPCQTQTDPDRPKHPDRLRRWYPWVSVDAVRCGAGSAAEMWGILKRHLGEPEDPRSRPFKPRNLLRFQPLELRKRPGGVLVTPCENSAST